jgi:hypothetical protein
MTAGQRLLGVAGCREAMLLLAAREHLAQAPGDAAALEGAPQAPETIARDEAETGNVERSEVAGDESDTAGGDGTGGAAPEDDGEEKQVPRARAAVAARLQGALDAALSRLALGESLPGEARPRAWPTSRVRQLLVERLHSFALLFYAYSAPLDGGGERGTSAEALAQLRADFRLHARLGCAQDRAAQLHAASSGGAISLLQLAQLLCDLEDTPAVRAAVRSDLRQAGQLPRVLDLLALQVGGGAGVGGALGSRLLAFGRRLPEAPLATARVTVEMGSLAAELTKFAVPAIDLRRAVATLLAAHRRAAGDGPASDVIADAAEGFVGGSGAQTGCAFPLLLEEQLRPPPASPAVQALLGAAALLVEPTGEGRATADGAAAAGRAVATLLDARALYAADLPPDQPFPPRASVHFLCRLSMAAAAAGQPANSLEYALQASLAADQIGAESDSLHACVACVVGTAAFRLRAFNLAIASFVRALAVREAGQAHALDMTVALNNLGAALECAAQPRLAFQLYRRAHYLLSQEVR